MRLLLNAGATVNSKVMNGKTPLWLASWRGYYEIVKLLIDAGANVNSKDENGWTPLHAGSVSGNLEVLALLLDHGGLLEVDNSGEIDKV